MRVKTIMLLVAFFVLAVSFWAVTKTTKAWATPKVRLTSMCQNQEGGLMRFREESGVKDCVEWKAKVAGGDYFAKGCVNGGEETFFTAPKGTVIVEWSYGEHGGKETKAQNQTACATPTPEPTATPAPTATPFEPQACGRGCVVDADCRRYDPSYICYKDNTCRVENNSEDPNCTPRDPKPESVISVEELKSLPAGVK